MIVKSTWRHAGGLEAHLLRSDTNEVVQVRTDLFRGPDNLHAALQLMELLARTNPRVQRSFIHVVISPDHDLSDAELTRALALVEAEHGLSPDLRAVVAHLKGTRATHVHAVYPVIDPDTGRVVRSHGNFERDELISRRLELEFGERITPGPRIRRNIAELRRRGLDIEADCLAPYLPVRDKDSLTGADRQQASRLGVKDPEWSARAFALFEAAGSDLGSFADRLEAAGLSIARGSTTLLEKDGITERQEKAVLLVDDATGYSTSLVRLLRRQAKATGRPLKISEREVDAAFPRALPFEKTRDIGLERARTRAEHDLAAEHRNAELEAALDGDAEELAAYRKRRKQRQDEEAQAHAEARATLKARREAIAALYRERDAVRRRRVDRAFRAARLLDTLPLRRAAFVLAAAGVLMTGGGLALALTAGVIALEVLPTRARARAAAAAARHERGGDAVRRRAETDAAYREARAAADRRSSGAVRFTFDRVPKADRVLAGFFAQSLLHGVPLPPDARAAGDALGPEVVAGLTGMLERGSPLQVRRLLHWHHGVAPDRRGPAIAAALARHFATMSKPNRILNKSSTIRPSIERSRTRANRNDGHGL